MSEPLPPLPYDWSRVREDLQRQIWRLLDRLNLKHEARTKASDSIWPRNPMRSDNRPGSFVIWTEGGFAGAWKDYAMTGAGSKGDVFDLIAGVERLRSKIDTYWWALDFLGLDRRGNATAPRTKSDLEAERDRRERDRVAAEAKRQEDEEGKSEQLFRWWLGLKPIAGTLAETYLVEARKIDLPRIRTPGALRFAPALDHIDKRTGEVTNWPAMVSAMTRGKRVVALHRTWLARDGSGKAPVFKPKMMIGPSRGAQIRLTYGAAGMNPAKAATRGLTGPLVVGEGIETSLSVGVARPDYRAWAAGSLGHLGLIEWPPCASAVALLRDNDWGAEAQKAFDAAFDAWRVQARGRPLMAVASAVGSDFNDWLTRAA